MALKTIQLLLGGEMKTLSFGRMTVLKYAGEIVDDPLSLFAKDFPPKSAYQRILAFVYAGLKSAGDPSSIEQIDAWVQDMSFEDAASVITKANEAILGGNGQAGEAEAQALVNQSAGES